MSDPIRLSVKLEDAAEPPKAFRLFAAGAIETTKGVFLFDEKSSASVMAAAADWGNEFPVDYGHSMLGFIQVDPAESGKAAGWFRPEVRNGELWAADVTWTPPASEKLRNREYRYVSPAFHADEDGRITELLNCALTNIPATKRAPAIVAHRGEAQETPPMKNLLAKLGLAENATEAEALSALEKFAAFDALAAFERDVLALSGKADRAEAMAVLSGLKAQAEQATELSARLAKIEADQKAATLLSMLDEATKSGRLTPANREKLLAADAPAFAREPATLKTFLDMLPAPATSAVTEPAKADPVATLSAEELAIAKQMGLKPEDVAARKAARQ